MAIIGGAGDELFIIAASLLVTAILGPQQELVEATLSNIAIATTLHT